MFTALLVSTCLFGIIAILLSFESDRTKKRLLEKIKSIQLQLDEIAFYKDIQMRTAYTTDVEKIIDILMGSLKNLFPYSVASSIVVNKDSLSFKTYIEDYVSREYINQVKKSMLTSLSEFLEVMPVKIDERQYGVSLNDKNSLIFSSSFHIPLFVNNKVLALIHLSSIKENMYENMSVLTQLIQDISGSITNFSKALDTERDRFISLVKSIEDGIFMTDNKNNLLLVNDSLLRILNITKSDVNFFDITNALPSPLEISSKINEVILNSKSQSEKAIKINDKIYDISISPATNNRASIVLHDISDHKQMESLKEDYMHIMVHELRAPLTTIKDSAELIITSKDTLEEEKKTKFLEIIHQQAKKLLSQISSILDTAKMDAGKFTIQKTQGDIGKLIQDEVQSFAPQAERKHIDLTYDILHNNMPQIFFDATRITQVIDNLLSNSLKFTAENGKIKVEIDYRTVPPSIFDANDGQILSLDKYIFVSVSDTGVGIVADQQKHLFSKYTQAQDSPQKIAKLGTGLGLYVVKGIVEAHGGKVWAKSNPGEGTTISFILPTISNPPVNINDQARPSTSSFQTVN